MAWFFTNPILGRIEDALWKKAEAEIAERIKSGQLNLSPSEIKREVTANFKALFSKQRPVAKLALKSYKKIAEEKAAEALALTIGDSHPDWYSVEEAWSTGVPVVLAVPLRLVRGHAEFRFAQLLPDRIEFADLLPEAQAEFAKEAIATYFSSDIKRSIRNRVNFQAKGFYPYDLRLVDLIIQDHYYMGDNTSVSREDMLILNSSATINAWEEKYKTDSGRRPQNRRFTSASELRWKHLPS
jgi:hypothetical protein